MKRGFPKKSFDDLSMAGLAIDRCYIVSESLVRVFFRLSTPPPLGWSYIFTTSWQDLQYPLKRRAGVDGDAIWIECNPEEIAPHHFEKLEHTVAQSNEKYRERAKQRAFQTGQQSHLNSQILSQLEDLNQTLYPNDKAADEGVVTPRFWGSALFEKLGKVLGMSNR